MNILKRLANLFSAPSRASSPEYWLYVRCHRCGEAIRGRVNLYNDLSAEYEGGQTTLFVRKVLTGEGRCFQRVEVELTFDANRKLLNREIQGGLFITQEAYELDQQA